ncbi:hypothetical protein BJ875DRAFT_506208 [Amylocarpus encephaloides]|uniref:Uncharacterized protein n=1 Tax=Amylocarpus encephaloides TaxID=45428 RepID=A0A9P7YEG2_9HELO|nr:hypothetical protein BJ875DRAFT_506208 [Amylocarpus encephaloides]
MSEKKPRFVIVLACSSKGGPLVIDGKILDLIAHHHLRSCFPEGATAVSACHYPPICKELHPDLRSEENTLKGLPPFPNIAETFKRYTKSLLMMVEPKPKSSKDGRIVVLHINSQPQAHRVIATRRSLKAVSDLEVTELFQRCGASFARRHREDSGGNVNADEGRGEARQARCGIANEETQEVLTENNLE